TQAALTGRVPPGAGQRAGLDRAPAAVGPLHVEPGAVGVGRVEVRRDALLAVQPGGEADVVGVAVREDQRSHIVERQAESREFAVQQLPVTGQARVDDGHAAPVDDEVAVDGVRTDPVQSFGYLHDGASRAALKATMLSFRKATIVSRRTDGN